MKIKYLIDTYKVKQNDFPNERAMLNGHEVYVRGFHIGNPNYDFKKCTGNEESKRASPEDNVEMPAEMSLILANLGLQAIKDLQKQGIRFRLKDGDLELYE